jgi:protein ImuB
MEQRYGQIFSILHKWGIHAIGQFAALDKENLALRLGPEAVRLWELANGKSQRLLKLVRPPESFVESFEFDYEIETAEPLLFMLRRFLEQLTLRLRPIYLVPKELTLRIALADQKIYERSFKIPQPTGNVDLLFRMLQTHLENFKSDHAIVAVSLEAQPTKPPRQQFGLFETTLRNPHQLAETLARLSALVGVDRVGTPVLEDTHRRDAFRMEPFSWSSVAAAVPGGSNVIRTPHPTVRIAIRRFRPPASASIFISQDRHLQSEKVRGQIVEQSGPFLLSGNWWDEKAWRRAEWDMPLENGVICRSYQDENGWHVDGIYD